MLESRTKGARLSLAAAREQGLAELVHGNRGRAP